MISSRSACSARAHLVYRCRSRPRWHGQGRESLLQAVSLCEKPSPQPDSPSVLGQGICGKLAQCFSRPARSARRRMAARNIGCAKRMVCVAESSTSSRRRAITSISSAGGERLTLSACCQDPLGTSSPKVAATSRAYMASSDASLESASSRTVQGPSLSSVREPWCHL